MFNLRVIKMNTRKHQSNEFEPGDYVKLTDGYFQNYVGPIREILPGDKAIVTLSIFGRDNPVEIELSNLIAARPGDGHSPGPT